MGSERVKLRRTKEDRISDLPDSIIHHILSFLPSTKQAIQTSVLSKRWQNQWTRVPVLIFNFYGMSDCQSFNKAISRISRFIDTTLMLHDCSKIHKFHLEYPYIDSDYYHFTAKIRFATRKLVDNLRLGSNNQSYMLPKFLFSNVSLVELSFYNCTVLPNEKVNWGSLTTLHMCRCKIGDEAIQHILSGCPLLESLDIFRCVLDFYQFIIASKSLKKLVLQSLDFTFISCIEISCPNLEELSLKDLTTEEESEMLSQGIENVLSSSSLLESFEISGFGAFTTLLIASKSLKKLVLSELGGDAIQVSCPKLEKLKILYGLGTDSVKLLNLPTSLSATCDFHQYMQYAHLCYEYDEKDKSLIRDILQQLQHVKKLKLGIWIMEVLSDLEVEGLPSPMPNIKCLCVNHPYLNRHHSGIACLLRSSPLLEKLVIKVPPYYAITRDLDQCFDLPKLNDFGEKYWNSNAAVFNCLVSHLKTIKIIGFPKRDGRRKLVIKFVQFLLKNARVLEKLVVVLEDDEMAFQLKVSRELLNLLWVWKIFKSFGQLSHPMRCLQIAGISMDVDMPSVVRDDLVVYQKKMTANLLDNVFFGFGKPWKKLKRISILKHK